MADWDKARADAIKLLGKDAKVPDIPDAILKAVDAFVKADDAFKKSREDCESKLLDVQNANSAIKNAIQQFKSKIEKSDFDLDAKSDGKKIAQAEKMLVAPMLEGIKIRTSIDKTLDELDKHLLQLSKYKAPPDNLS